MAVQPPCKRQVISSNPIVGTSYVVIMEQKNNPRKFRIWDSKLLHDSLQLCVQYQSAIEESISNSEKILEENEVLISTVPTETLYDIANCYIAMYEKLLVEGLIQSNSSPQNINRQQIH